MQHKQSTQHNKQQQINQSLLGSLIQQPKHRQSHISNGDIIKSLIYGGLDGGVYTLILVLTGFGANKSPKSILSFCIAAIVGGGIDMGLGDYLSAKTEINYIKLQEERQYYEIQNNLNAQIQQIIDIYHKKGYSFQDANRVAHLYSTNSQAFVNIMMLEQLGLVVVDQSLAAKCGVTTLFSFMILGILPVIPYIITSAILGNEDHNIISSLVIGGIQLFGLGFGKAMMIGINRFKSGMQTLLLAAVATSIGYGVGTIFPQ